MGDKDDTPSPESSSDEDFVMEDYDSEEDDYDMSKTKTKTTKKNSRTIPCLRMICRLIKSKESLMHRCAKSNGNLRSRTKSGARAAKVTSTTMTRGINTNTERTASKYLKEKAVRMHRRRKEWARR